MPYILDSGFFVISREYYPETFPSFWRSFDELVSSGMVSSVDRVRREIERYGGEQKHLLGWVKENRRIFTEPSQTEQEYISEILSKFSNLVEMKNTTKDNYPDEIAEPDDLSDPDEPDEPDEFAELAADPLVIAKGIVTEQGVVVTRELPAKRDRHGNIQGVPRIPDICRDYKIRCITPQQFLTEQGWRF